MTTFSEDQLQMMRDAALYPRSEYTAIVHDWMMTIGGGENVVSEIVDVCPNCEVFVAFEKANRDLDTILKGRPLHASALNKLPMVEKYYKNLLLLAARAIEAFDVSRFDIVISSSSAVAKGVITAPGQPHIAYVHSPARYAWDLTHEYLRLHGLNRGLKGMIARELMHRFRNWDSRTVNGVDIMIANSQFVRERIWKVYRRDSLVIHPPVDIDRFDIQRGDGRHFVTTSRLVGYKRVDLMIDAFAQRRDLRLVVIGGGPELEALKAKATSNVEFLGHVPMQTLLDVFAGARAFLYCALEDFGIAPVEAQAAGLPVIALGKGGTAETICADASRGENTGVFYHEQSVPALLSAIAQFESMESEFKVDAIKAHATRFSAATFRRKLAEVVERAHELAAMPASAVPD